VICKLNSQLLLLRRRWGGLHFTRRVEKRRGLQYHHSSGQMKSDYNSGYKVGFPTCIKSGESKAKPPTQDHTGLEGSSFV